MNGHNWQTGDDIGNDVWWHGTVKDRKNTFSIGAGFLLVSNQIDIQLKYFMDYAIRQRFKTQLFGLSVLYMPKNLLTVKAKK